MRAILVGVLLTINITTFATTSNPLTISGVINNSSGEAMPAVIVEQCATNNYTLSDIDGCFELQLLPKKPQKITISFIGYQKQTIDLKKNSSNNLVVILNKIEETHQPQPAISKLPKVSCMTVNIGYEYYDSRFDKFSELKSDEVNLMNKLDHFFTIGIAGSYRNIYGLLSWGFTPSHTQSFMEYNYKHTVESRRFLFKMGYIFPLAQNKVLLTPTLGVTRTSYDEYFYPYDKEVSLTEFLMNSSTNVYYKQYCGILGLDADFRLAAFGNRKQHNLYLSAGTGYIFKLHHFPHIKSNKTILTSNNEIIQKGLYIELSLKYYYIVKNKKDKKNHNYDLE